MESLNQAEAIFARLVQWLNNQGLFYNNLNVKIKLCVPSELEQELRGRGGRHSLGTTFFQNYTLFGLLKLRTEVKAVTVVRGLPTTLFQGVAVHELGHVWLAVNGILSFPDWAMEGFCELLAYRFFNQIGTAEGRYYATTIERNADPVYGEGFRKILSLSDFNGFHFLVNTLRSNKQLPSVGEKVYTG